MYCITDEQIDYILNDIRRGGIETEDLQLNLLDHICCIMEQELKEDGDFERLYHATARQFYKTNMRELEEETINLLTFKHYYAMKKVMIGSGALSAAILTTGSIFKLAHWPGAGILLFAGIVSFSLLFLPLLFVLKAREAKNARDRMVTGLACLLGIVFSLATLFTVMHWPGSSMLWFTGIGLSAFVLLPVYFFTGIRQPETKLNTILMSILLIGITGLQFTMMNTRPSLSQTYVRVQSWMQSESLLKAMQTSHQSEQAAGINALCEQIKSLAIGHAATDPVHELTEGRPGDYFFHNGEGLQLIARLHQAVTAYNSQHNAEMIPIENSLLTADPEHLGHVYSNVSILSSITQIQLYLAHAENNGLASAK